MAGKPRHLFLPTIFQSRPVRETPIVGAASSRDRGRSVSEGSACGRSAAPHCLVTKAWRVQVASVTP